MNGGDRACVSVLGGLTCARTWSVSAGGTRCPVWTGSVLLEVQAQVRVAGRLHGAEPMCGRLDACE